MTQFDLLPESVEMPDSKSARKALAIVPVSPLKAGEKSPSALRTISEACAEIGVEAHVLRFWETQFPQQVKPLKRRAGRRYYRPEDIRQLKEIKAKLYQEGYTIKGAKQSFRKPAIAKPVAVATKPSNEKKAMQAELTHLHKALCAIRDRLQSL